MVYISNRQDLFKQVLPITYGHHIMNFQQPDFNQHDIFKKKRWPSVLFLGLIGAGIIYGSLWLGILTSTIVINKNKDSGFLNKVAYLVTFAHNRNNQNEEIDPNYIMPEEEKERLDILVLGIRGKNDPDAAAAGAYLTDTIMVFSYDKLTNKTSVISIPRDLYIKIYNKHEKINAAYSEALAHNEGLDYVKTLVSQVSGIYIDHAVVIDFSSFEKIIDELGGVDIVLDKPFTEKTQWGYEFNLLTGSNHLNGKNALYYARSRYSTNDFDRARRQQQIIFALKSKLSKIKFFTDPTKVFLIFNTIRNNTQTDIGLWDMKNLILLTDKINGRTVHQVISVENLLYQTTINGAYALLPNGDNFDGIKQFFQNSLK